MKVARSHLVGGTGSVEVPAALHDHIDHAGFLLQDALYDQTLRSADRAAETLVNIGTHDDVD